MRISDWSSDVCSSDLGGGHPRKQRDQLLHPASCRWRSGDGESAGSVSDLLVRDSRTSSGQAQLFDLFGAEWRKLPHLGQARAAWSRSEEPKSELQSLMRTLYAVLCSKQKTKTH